MQVFFSQPDKDGAIMVSTFVTGEPEQMETRQATPHDALVWNRAYATFIEENPECDGVLIPAEADDDAS